MPTKKGKSKPAKANKVSNKTRRGATGKAKPAGTTRKSAAAGKSSARKKPAGRKKATTGKLRRTEAGPVWIGSSPAPINLPREDPGSNKVTGAGSERVRIM